MQPNGFSSQRALSLKSNYRNWCPKPLFVCTRTRHIQHYISLTRRKPYSLYDVTGKLVQSGIFESQAREERIDVSTLGAGMYFLKVSEQRFKVVIDN